MYTQLMYFPSTIIKNLRELKLLLSVTYLQHPKHIAIVKHTYHLSVQTNVSNIPTIQRVLVTQDLLPYIALRSNIRYVSLYRYSKQYLNYYSFFPKNQQLHC